MTGNELRQKVANIINGWVGATRGSAGHKEILSIYNNFTPLARGYKVQASDAYCATTASAAFIKAGIAAYTGTECSVPWFIVGAANKGIWTENDAYVPKIGDAVCYDWDDSGYGDNTGAADHIGVVTAVSGSAFTVTEGNMSGGVVGKRNMAVNGKYIRGFITPDYDAIAAKLSGGTVETKQFRAGWWKLFTNKNSETPVFKDSNLTTRTGSLNAGEQCYCTGRYGDAYAVCYKIDGTDDDWAVGYVAYHGGVTE